MINLKRHFNILLTLILLFSIKSWAVCNPPVQTLTIPAQDIIVPRNTAVGSIFKEIIVPTGVAPNTVIVCDDQDAAIEGIPVTFTQPTNGQPLYATQFHTNIPGIDIELGYTSDNTNVWSQLGWFPIQAKKMYVPSGARIAFIYNGGDISGVMNGGVLFNVNLNRQFTFLKTILTVSLMPGSKVIGAKCSVQQPNIPVNLGTFNASDFTGMGSVSPNVDFTIQLDCDANASVNIQFDGTTVSNSQGVIALDSTSSPATGLGVQLLYYSKVNVAVPVTIGTPIKAGSVSNNGGPLNIYFTARYYQTTGTVKGGNAAAFTTFTITYN